MVSRRLSKTVLGVTPLLCATGVVTYATPALAQSDSTVLVTPALPDDYDRARNISVLERPRTDYDELGIQLGSVLVKPKADLALGYTDNAYLASGDKKGAAFVSVVPVVTANTDWDRDLVNLYASGGLQRYFGETRRNQSIFDLRALGRKDIGSDFSLTGEAQYARLYESPQTGATTSELAVLSHYRRSYESIRGQYTGGRSRVIIAVDHVGLTFDDIDLGDGTTFNQTDRDRVVNRVTGEVQYALSPSVSLYGQGSFNDINYSQRLLNDGSPNRDSDGYRVLGGVNFDLAGSMRGKVGIGYVRRDYNSNIYRDVGGVSIEAALDFFPSELTTISVGAGRTLEDSSIFTQGAYFDNRVSAGVDHEFLVNLIGSAKVEYRHQVYKDSSLRSDIVSASGTLRYLSTRFLSLFGTLAYVNRDNSIGGGPGFSEFRGQLGVTVQR